MSSQYPSRHSVPPHGLHHPPPGQSPKHPIHPHHHTTPASRIHELVDALKHEVDLVTEELAYTKHHRKDMDAKLTAQIGELQTIQSSIYDLERVHTAMKKQYEEEIMRLRHELESRGIPLPPTIVDTRQYRKPNLPEHIPPPQLSGRSHMGGGAFGNLIQGYEKDTKRLKMDHPQRQHVALKPVQQGGPPQGPSPHHHPSTPHQQPPPTPVQQSGPPVQQGPPPGHQQAPGNHQPPQGPPASVQGPPRDYRQYPPPQRSTASPQPPVPQPQPTAPSQIRSDEIQLVVHPRYRSLGLNVELLHTLDHSSVVCCVRFSRCGKFLATGCNHLAQIYDLSGRKIMVLIDETINTREDLYIRSVCFSPDGVFLATGAEDKTIRVWDIARGRVKLKLQGHEQDIYSLEWTKDGKYIISGSGDRTTKIWEAETGKLIRTLVNDESSKDAGVTSIGIHENLIVTGSLDDVIRIWDFNGNLLEKFLGHEKSVYSVAFSPDGTEVASGSLDQTVRIWEVGPETIAANNSLNSGAPAAKTAKTTTSWKSLSKGHQDYVLTVGYPGRATALGNVDKAGNALEPLDINWVVSGGKDRHVLFWDKEEMVVSMSGHKNSVISVCVGGNGIFATGSGDQKARIWRVYRQPQYPSLQPSALREQHAPEPQAREPQNVPAQPLHALPPGYDRRGSVQVSPITRTNPAPSSPQIQQHGNHAQTPVMSLPVIKDEMDTK